jgi:hypothetical protein
MRIRTSLGIGKLKRPRTTFRLYLNTKRVCINKAKLGTKEGFSLGRIHKAHPGFPFCGDMKEQLHSMMSKYFKDMKYALFPRTVKYKRGSDGMTLALMMNQITIQVANTENTLASDLRAAMAE